MPVYVGLDVHRKRSQVAVSMHPRAQGLTGPSPYEAMTTVR
jgi:hypothetical protein